MPPTRTAAVDDPQTADSPPVSAALSPQSTPVEKVAAKALSSGGVATFEQLRAKPRRVSTFTITMPAEDGESTKLTMKYQAITSKAYDALVAECPPSTKEKQLGAQYDADAFAPALISAVSYQPPLTLEQAEELYTSPSWSGGEISTLFIEALRVCNAGLDVPFNVSV